MEAALGDQPDEPALLQLRAEVLGHMGRAEEASAIVVELADRMAGRGFGQRAIELIHMARGLWPSAPGLEEQLRLVAALEHFDEVASSPLFEMFTRDELIEVVRALEAKTFEPGEILLTEGRPGRSLFVIASGTVRIYKTGPDGWPVHLKRLHAPQFYGEIALLDGGVRTATVIAASVVNVLELEPERFEKLRALKPRIEQVLRDFARQRIDEQLSSVA